MHYKSLIDDDDGTIKGKSSESVQCAVNVFNKSGGGNHHFRDLETTANDVRKAEKTISYRKYYSKPLLSATTL